MKNLKKILAAILVIAVMVTAMVPAIAATTSYSNKAEATALHTLGLYPGIAASTATFNPDLGAKLTREKSVVMALQLFKLQAKVNKISKATALKDLKVFYKDATTISTTYLSYVDYAVQNGFINPVGTKYAPKTQIKGNEFCTLLLKVMGYTVETAYDRAYSASLLAKAGGLSVANAVKFNGKLLTKDDAVALCFAALKSKDFMGVVVAEGMVPKMFSFEAGIKAGVIKLKQDPAPAGAIFWDDFEHGLSKWTPMQQAAGTDAESPIGQKWAVVVDSGSHVMTQTVSTNAVGDTVPFFMMAGDYSWVNYTVEAKVKPVSMPGGAINLTARYNSPQAAATYYVFQIEKVASGYALNFKKFSSEAMVKLTMSYTIDLNKWYDMKMTVEGNTITCYLDGKLMFSYYDQNPIPSGKAGISGWGATPYIDSFSVVPGPATEIEPAPVPSTVTATNGKINVTLDKAPAVLPKLKDFVISQQIEGVDATPAAIDQTTITVSYDLSTGFVFTVPAVSREVESKVTYSVKYAGGTAVSAPAVTVPAEFVPRVEGTSVEATYGSTVTITAANYATTAVKYQICDGTTPISDVATIGTATTVYPAKGVGEEVTVKVLAADGTTVIDTKVITLK